MCTIKERFGVPNLVSNLLAWNPVTIPDQDTVLAGTKVNYPFSLWLHQWRLAHVFSYSVSSGDTYDLVASYFYANLTTVPWLKRFNNFPESNIPDTGVLNVTVNCSCGNKAISEDYGLFITWPIQPGDSYQSVATADVVRRYNPTANFTAGSGLWFVRGRRKF